MMFLGGWQEIGRSCASSLTESFEVLDSGHKFVVCVNGFDWVLMKEEGCRSWKLAVSCRVEWRVFVVADER